MQQRQLRLTAQKQDEYRIIIMLFKGRFFKQKKDITCFENYSYFFLREIEFLIFNFSEISIFNNAGYKDLNFIQKYKGKE